MRDPGPAMRESGPVRTRLRNLLVCFAIGHEPSREGVAGDWDWICRRCGRPTRAPRGTDSVRGDTRSV